MIFKTSNKLVFEKVFEMVFIPNICTVKTYGKTSDKYNFTQIWNELVQHLSLDLLDQSRPKTKNLFVEYFLKN